MSHLAQLLETQMKDRTEALQAFDQSEEAWKAQLEATTAELGRHASRPESTDMEEPIDVDAEMDVQEQKVMDAAEEEARRTVKAQRQREEADTKAQALLTTLQNLQSEAKRDGSRTPRRMDSRSAPGKGSRRARQHRPLARPACEPDGITWARGVTFWRAAECAMDALCPGRAGLCRSCPSPTPGTFQTA